jgi:FkbM family methyltransferase
MTGTHGLARSLYNATTGRRASRLHSLMSKFYGALLPRNALVFDIGANVGSYSAIFSSLGARVVALEPNADCVRHIQLSYGHERIEAIQAVVGSQDGLATLSLSDERDDISSASKDWIAAIQREHDDYCGLWSKEVTVPMLKLDTLIGRYGVPYFIKIDVEGLEEQVLDGLSTQPSLLSFEFNTAYLDATLRCLRKELFLTTSLFNFAMGDPVSFELSTWVRADELAQALGEIGKGDRYGDIFVRGCFLN